MIVKMVYGVKRKDEFYDFTLLRVVRANVGASQASKMSKRVKSITWTITILVHNAWMVSETNQYLGT